MCKIRYSVAASLATFLIGVAISCIVVAVRQVPPPQLEQPPCRACAQIYATSEIPSVSICELRENLDHYRGKVVRLRAVFHHDAGQVHLVDFSCRGVGAIHTGLSNSCESCTGARKALSIYTGFGTWYDSAAHVVVVGRAGILENPTLFPDDDGFNIDCLENVEPMGSGLAERIKYRQGEWLRLLLPPPQQITP